MNMMPSFLHVDPEVIRETLLRSLRDKSLEVERGMITAERILGYGDCVNDILVLLNKLTDKKDAEYVHNTPEA